MTRVTVRRARRAHQCFYCDGSIKPGDRYVEVVGSPSGPELPTWWRVAECAPCVAINDRAVEREAP